MEYIHPEINIAQSPKTEGKPCGDLVTWKRDGTGTLVVLADGLGSGIKANLDATLFTAWIQGYIRDGISPRRAMANLMPVLRQARKHDVPFAALSLARIEPDGSAVVVSYEIPQPIVISNGYAEVTKAHIFAESGETLMETHIKLGDGDSLVLVSDGITQAGLGSDQTWGWTLDGVCKFINVWARQSAKKKLAKSIHDKAIEKSSTGRDDATVVSADCRRGRVVNILTGPPEDPEEDSKVIDTFMRMDGAKVVCGGTTAAITARETGREMEFEQKLTSKHAPPRAEIDGIDIVTEGSITLNQVYNLWDTDPKKLEEDSGVRDLLTCLRKADRVNIILGSAENAASEDITYLQRGILSRRKVIPLLANKLMEYGKLVSVNTDF